MIQVQISYLFGLSSLGAQCTYKRGSVAILIVPALVLFSPLNCTRMLAQLEINSTRGKNSRKYNNNIAASEISGTSSVVIVVIVDTKITLSLKIYM